MSQPPLDSNIWFKKTEKLHNWIQFLSEQKRQNPVNKHDQQDFRHNQWNLQIKKEKRTYQWTQN